MSVAVLEETDTSTPQRRRVRQATGHALTPTVVQLSGGFDSTRCLHDALVTGREVLVHHCRLVTREGRADVEDQATARILGWFRDQGHRFEYHTTTFDYGTVRPISLDLMIWSLTAGLICTTRAPRRKYHTVTVSASRTSNFAQPPYPGIIQTIVDTVARRPVMLEWPIVTLSKRDIITGIPEDLAELCWWCRTPRNGQPCGSCRTCRTVKDAYAQKR